METVKLTAAALASIAAIPFLIWTAGALINRLNGAAAHYASLTKSEKLSVDWLRAQGHTLKSAVQTLHEQPAEQWDPLADLSDNEKLIVARRIQADFLAGRMPPSVTKLYAEAVLEASARNR